MLRTGYYVKQMKSIRFFNPSSVIYVWGHRWILALLLIFVDWYKHSNTNFSGFQVHFESNMVYNLKAKSDFWSKWAHYIIDYIINLGSMFFLASLVWTLAYIDYSLCQIWSVSMQYLQCCDHSKKCLFLVVQEAEALLNFFWVSVFTSLVYWFLIYLQLSTLLNVCLVIAENVASTIVSVSHVCRK